MSRCIAHPTALEPAALRAVASLCAYAERHLNLGDFTRKSALALLNTEAKTLRDIHGPQLDRLWFNISTKKVYGRHLVVWGVGDEPELP